MHLTKALKEHADDKYPFHMPGHKRRLFADEILSDAYSIDITEIEGFDDLHEADGLIRKAQERAAKLYGADETHFLVNGSTGGILAAICGTVSKTDSIIVAANCHRSVYNAAMLSGAGLYIVAPRQEKSFCLCAGIDPERIENALSETSDEAGAVVITSPTYEGIVSDIRSIADICHRHGAVLIVDSAHGAHFGFSGAFPESPVALGADVVISGVHKTMPAMTQTALIHISRNCPSAGRIRAMLKVFTTSSPSYVLMASIDSMTDLIKEQKDELFEAYAKRLKSFYDKASALNNLKVLKKEDLTEKGTWDHDIGKIVIKDDSMHLSGKELSDILYDKYGICVEMAGVSYVILMTSVADTDEGFAKLEDALAAIDEDLQRRGSADIKPPVPEEAILPEGRYDNKMMAAMFEADAGTVPLEKACGMIARDLVTVYPPGIPVTLPGSVITDRAVRSLQNAQQCGLKITGMTGKEIAVLWERSST